MHFFCKGSGRFTRLWEAARDGEAAAPVDLRYLKRPNSRVMTDDAASTRGDIFSFLQYVYESQAETLPDFRDELKEELGAVTTIDLSTEDPYVVEMQHETKQTWEFNGIYLWKTAQLARFPESWQAMEKKRTLGPTWILLTYRRYNSAS